MHPTLRVTHASAVLALATLLTACGPLIRTVEPDGAEIPVVHVVDGDGTVSEERFGFVLAVDADAGEIAIDPAEWLTGQAATDAAREAGDLGEGETSVPNDYYIRNTEVDEVWLPVATDATITILTSTGDPTTEATVSLGELDAWLAANSSQELGFNLLVSEAGEVTSMTFAYRP